MVETNHQATTGQTVAERASRVVAGPIRGLRDRLAPMLANAGGHRLVVELLAEETLGRAFDEVEVMVRAAEARAAPA